MTVLRYFDPALRLLAALLLTIVAVELCLSGQLTASAVLMVWGPFAGFALTLCLLFPRSVRRHVGFCTILFAAVPLIIGLVAFGGGAMTVLLLFAIVPARVLFWLLCRIRPPEGGKRGRATLPSGRSLLIAVVALAFGIITPPLIKVLAATADEARRVDLVDALAAADRARRPRGDRLGFNGSMADAERLQAEQEAEVQAYLNCGGPALPHNHGLPNEARLTGQVTLMLDHVRNDDERRHFREKVAESNSALRIKAIQLCIMTGLCRRTWYEYLRKPDTLEDTGAGTFGYLPGDHAINERVAQDYACGAGFGFPGCPAPRFADTDLTDTR